MQTEIGTVTVYADTKFRRIKKANDDDEEERRVQSNSISRKRARNDKNSVWARKLFHFEI